MTPTPRTQPAILHDRILQSMVAAQDVQIQGLIRQALHRNARALLEKAGA